MLSATESHSLLPPSSFPHSHRHPLRAAFSIARGLYDIATFCISTLPSDLGIICIPGLRCLRTTHVIRVAPGALTFWSQPNSVFGCSRSNETSTMIHLHLPYHSILVPDRVTLTVPIPLTVPLNRVHCPQRFIPRPCRMVGRILEAELQVAASLQELIKWLATYTYATSCRT